MQQIHRVLSPSFDQALGQRLSRLIRQSGEDAFESGVISRRLQAQLQDLLGAETSLLNPLRDLLQRPAFRQLFQLNSQGQILNARDALMRDLAEVYSPAIVSRLDAVLQGCLNLPAGATTWPSAQPASPQPPSVPAYDAAPPPSQLTPTAPPAATVVTIPERSQAASTIVIALLALICGALVMALAGVLINSRGNNGTTSATPAPNPVTPPAAAPAAPPSQKPQAPEQPAETPAPSSTDQWQACVAYSSEDGPPPQAGETWWPVVGPGEALEAARQHCRSDAFTNAGGNVQVASFRDRDTAAAFAEQLTRDNSHPYSFWVGDPSLR